MSAIEGFAVFGMMFVIALFVARLYDKVARIEDWVDERTRR